MAPLMWKCETCPLPPPPKASSVASLRNRVVGPCSWKSLIIVLSTSPTEDVSYRLSDVYSSNVYMGLYGNTNGAASIALLPGYRKSWAMCLDIVGINAASLYPCQRLSDPLCHSYMRNTIAVYICPGKPLVRTILLLFINFNRYPPFGGS